jgi:hypothetical protein
MTTSYTNDGSGNQTASANTNPGGEPPSETDKLLLDKGKESTEDTFNDEGDENGGFLSTIVEGFEQAQEAATGFTTAIVEGFVDGYENVVEGVETFTENASELGNDYKGAFLDNLHDKDEGNTVLYEMSMARNLSILPSDMEIFAEDMTLTLPVFPAPKPGHRRKVSLVHTFTNEEGQQQEVTVEKTVYTGKIPLHAYMTLLLAVICLSSIGPSLDFQKDVAPTMKIYWRMTATYLVLAPMAFRSIYKDGFPKLTNSQLCTFGMSAFSYAFFCVTFVIALEFTSVGNVVIFR